MDEHKNQENENQESEKNVLKYYDEKYAKDIIEIMQYNRTWRGRLRRLRETIEALPLILLFLICNPASIISFLLVFIYVILSNH